MSRYIMSDIHGCYNEFIKMLKIINFTDMDELYIIGDIFDRGDEPLKILDYIVNHKNITLIRGNHEKFFTSAYENNQYDLWYLNGGKITNEQIMLRGEEYAYNLYNYIKSLPIIKVIDKYILVHASLRFEGNYNEKNLKTFLNEQIEETCFWGRQNIGCEKQYKDYIVISGHTPVQAIDESIEKPEDVKIIHRKGTIYIDCGCCYGKEAGGKLACIRLDDMKEFYVYNLN